HVICWNCGHYKGEEVINVLERLDKKERKKREKEMAAQEKEKPLDAASLSKK
ncbi:MAG: 50S ribosomal protein L32, partial [Patescibacteria group bacterium]